MPPSSSESEPWWHWPWSLAECSASPADQHTKKDANTKLMTCTRIDARKNSKHARIHASGHLGARHGNFKPTTWKNTTQKLINLQRCTFMALGVCNWRGTISWKGHVKKNCKPCTRHIVHSTLCAGKLLTSIIVMQDPQTPITPVCHEDMMPVLKRDVRRFHFSSLISLLRSRVPFVKAQLGQSNL